MKFQDDMTNNLRDMVQQKFSEKFLCKASFSMRSIYL